MKALHLLAGAFCCSVLLINTLIAEPGSSADLKESTSSADFLPKEPTIVTFSLRTVSGTPPINDDCANAIELFGDGVLECGESEEVYGDPCATGDVEATGNCVTPSDPGLWYTFETPIDMGYGTVLFEWLNSSSMGVELFHTTSGCSGLTYVNCGEPTLHIDALPGTTYYILVDGDLVISALDPSFESDCNDPNEFFVGGGNWHASTNSCADPSAVVPCQGQNVMWYNYVANECPASDLELSLIPSGVAGVSGMDDGSLTVFLADCVTLATEYDPEGDSYVCSTVVGGEVLNLEDVPPGTELLIAVGSGPGNAGFYVINVMETPTAIGGIFNDECIDAIPVVEGNNDDLTNECATQDIVIPSCPSESEATVWFEYDPQVPLDITVNVIPGGLVSPGIAAWNDCDGDLLAESCGTTIELTCFSDPILIEVGSATSDMGTFELEIITSPALPPPLPELMFDDICSGTEINFFLEFLGGLSGDITVSIDPSSSSDITGMNEFTFEDVSSATVQDLLINCGTAPAEVVYQVSSSVPGFTCPGMTTQAIIMVNPKFEKMAGDIESCLPFLLELEATDLFSGGLAPYASFEWLWNGGPLATGTPLLYNLVESGDLTLRVIDAAGCEWETMIEVTTSPIVEPELTLGEAELCYGPLSTFVDLEILSANIIDDVDWIVLDADGDAVELGDGNSLGYAIDGFNPAGSYTIQAIVEDALGCEGESNVVDLTIAQTPSGALVVEPGPNCQSILSVVFYGLNGEDIYGNGPDSNGDGLPDVFDMDNDGVADFDEINWIDPVLGMISSSDLFYPVSTDGTYGITLVTEAGCVSDIASLAVTLGNQTAPQLIGPDTFCQGDSLKIFVSPSGLSGHNWTVDGNVVSVLPGAAQDTLRLLPNDTTSITLMVEDAQGCVFTLTKQFLPLDSPSFMIIGSSSICPGLTASISIFPDAGVDTAGWRMIWRNSAMDSIANGTTVSIGNAGVYSLTVTTPEGCMVTETFTISEDADLNIEILGDDFCFGKSATLTAGGGYDTYAWYDTQGMLVGTDDELVVTEAGEYSLTVRLGSCSGSDALTVNSVLPPIIDLPAEIEVCNNAGADNNVNLSALSAASDAGVWSSPQWPALDLTDLGSVSFEAVPLGTYTLTYTTTTAVSPCVDISQSMIVEVVDCPCPDFNLDNYGSHCNYNDSYLLDDQLGAGAVSGTWSFLDGPTNVTIDADNIISAQNVDPGEYRFLYTADTPMAGCPDSDTLFLAIVAPPRIVYDPNTTVCNSISTLAPTILNLDDLVLERSVEWIDPLIPGLDFSNPQNLNFEGLPDGFYTLMAATTNADFPCLNIEFDVDLWIRNCDCPVINLGADLDLCNDAALVDLGALSAASADGTWTLLMSNPQAASIVNDIVDLTGFLPGNYAIEYVLTTPSPACPEMDTLMIQLSAPPLLSPFVDTVVCNKAVGTQTTVLDMTAMVMGNYGEWIDPQIPSLDFSDPAQLDFTGIPAGDYSFVHVTNTATAPCMEVTQTLTLVVEDCACPVLDVDPLMNLCNDAGTVDLSQTQGFSAPGAWTESNTNPVSSLLPNNEVVLTNEEAGSYQFFFTLLDPIVGCADRDTLEIQLSAAPQVMLTDTVVCNIDQGSKGTVLDFTTLVQSAGGEWTDPNIVGLDFSDLDNVDFAEVTPGLYKFTFTTNTALPPCLDQQSEQTITVLDCSCPIIDLGTPPDLCLGDQSLDLTTLSGVSAPGIWVASIANLQDIPITNGVADFSDAVAGGYVFYYDLIDPVAGCASDGNVAVSLFAPPVIEETRDTVACNAAFGGRGTVIDLTSLVNGDAGYFLDADSELIVDAAQYDCKGLEVGAEITVTYMTDSAIAPCPDFSEAFVITIIDCSCDEPQFLDPPTLCNGVDEVVDLNDLLLSAHIGTWTLVDQPQSSGQALLGSELSYLDIVAGIYQVDFALTVPVDGCPSSWSFDLTVVEQESAEVAPLAEICIEPFGQGIYDLDSAVTTGGDNGNWLDAMGDPIDEQQLIFQPGEEGSYRYSYVVENPLPCAPLAYDMVLEVTTCTIAPDTLIYLPNIIDLSDDTESVFQVYSNIAALKIKTLSIYDRWGELVYQLKDLPVNTTAWGWDGTFNGQLVEQGVYVYVLELEGTGRGSGKVVVDDLTVLR